MRSLKSGLVTIAVSAGFGLAAVVGCSADGASGEILDPTSEQSPTEGTGAVLPPSSNTDTAAPADAGKPKADAGKPKSDAGSGGVDAGPPPPTPGSACTTVDQVANKACGKCGEASALCQSDKTWSQYGACEGETGECVPGETAPCGNCGTKTCDQFCGWGACTGEPANSCAPGSSEQSTVGCPPSGNVKPYRTRSCKTDCTWDSFSTTCFTPPSWNPIPIELTAAKTTGRLSLGNCPASSVDSSSMTAYTYTTVTNPSSAPVRVTIYHSKDAAGPANFDSIITAYTGSTPPTTETDRKNCLVSVGDQSTNDTALTGGYNFAIVKGITIPANGAITVYSAAWSTTGTGKLVLNVKAE